jgi:RNA polymerase sigma factor (sigma-70 family)
MQRYEGLYSQALLLTSRNEQLAEDLVHDAFIQFTVVQPDLSLIRNLDAYLYGMLRKLLLSHIRRSSRIRYFPSLIVEYETAEIGLKASELDVQLSLTNDLSIICQYACTRKDTSKAGSVLLLRFFLGYYPSEIAMILRSSRNAVDDWLRIARREARQHLAIPSRSRRASSFQKLSASSSGRSPDQFLNDLHHTIFSQPHAKCISEKELQAVYKDVRFAKLETKMLGQIVGCPRCLDRVSRLLQIPPPSDRYLLDVLGQDTRDRDRKTGEDSA